MASFTKLKANKKTIASLKVVAAWLVIVAMLIEAPLTLYVYAQQGYLGSETVQDAPPNLPYIGDEDVIALDEPAAAVANPVAYLEETLLFLEEERDYLVAELNRLDEMQTDVENYLNQQVIRLSNQQFALQQEINDLGRTALANELTSELNELTALLAETRAQLDDPSLVEFDSFETEREELLALILAVEEEIENVYDEMDQILNGNDTATGDAATDDAATDDTTGDAATDDAATNDTATDDVVTDDAATDDEYPTGYEYPTYEGYPTDDYPSNDEVPTFDFPTDEDNEGTITISGTVTCYYYSTPLEGVVVELTIGEEILVAETNDQGFYQIMFLPEDEEEPSHLEAVLTATLEGYAAAYVYLADYIMYLYANELTINFVLEPELYLVYEYGEAVVTGTVILEGGPVEGATVYFHPAAVLETEEDGYEDVYFTAITDAYGRFSIVLPAHEDTVYSVVAVHQVNADDSDVHQRAVSPTVELLLDAYDAAELDLELFWMNIRPAQIVYISNAAQLSAFLAGTAGIAGNNHSTFVLTNDINMAGLGPFHGRPYVGGISFQGTFDGQGHTISNLALIPRTSAHDRPPNIPVTQWVYPPYHNDFGFIRVLGHGAVIENVTFTDAAYVDGVSLPSWNIAQGNIGIVAGRVAANSIVQINNVTVNGTNVETSSTITFAGGARTTANKRVGGFVGYTAMGSMLNITNSTTRLVVSLNTTGTPGAIMQRNVQVAGGFVGATTGSVNIRGDENAAHLITNIGTPHATRFFIHAGGAIGLIQTPGPFAAFTIENLSVTGGISTVHAAGGIIGHSVAAALNAIRIYNSVNRAQVVGPNAGGIIGISAGSTIINTANMGPVMGENAGGIVGNGTSALVNSVYLDGVHNHAPVGGLAAAGGLVGAGASVRIENSQNHAQVGFQGTPAGAGTRVGGLIGTSSGVVNVVNSHNRGEVVATSTFGTGAAGRTTTAASGIGGIIGRMSAGNATIVDTVNHANVTSPGGNVAGFVGRSNGAGSITIRNSHNHGNIASGPLNTGRRAGSVAGFIGDADGSVAITGSTNHGNVTGVGFAGGIVGRTAVRAGSTTVLSNVNNLGTQVTTSSSVTMGVGGFVGLARNPLTIAGGLNINPDGVIIPGAPDLDNPSLNRANVSLSTGGGTLNGVGGIVGRSNNNLNINNVQNAGHVSIARRGQAGGIVGLSRGNLTIANATNGLLADSGLAPSSLSPITTNSNPVTGGNVWFTGDITNASSNIGGIAGRIEFRGSQRSANLTNVRNHAIIGANATGAPVHTTHAGGIVGNTIRRARSSMTITDAINTGNVNGTISAGGIVGRLNSGASSVTGALNRGNVTSSVNTGTAGGIVGSVVRGNDLRIANTGNEGAVQNGTGTAGATAAGPGAGGIIGNITSGPNIRIETSFNAGAISGSNRNTGGIIGNARGITGLQIRNCYNVGTVHGRNATAAFREGNGILGHAAGRRVIQIHSTYNAGNVQGAPIFEPWRLTGAARTRRINNTIFDMVYYDNTVHTGHPQIPLRGIQGWPTALLTSGELAGISSGVWLIDGWMANLAAGGDPMWETYPYLSWQTQGIFEDQFFQVINPGADHLVTASSVNVNFIGVFNNRPCTREFIRLFNPYRARVASAAAMLYEDIPGTNPGPVNHTTSVLNRPVGSRMSIGLISARGVVAFDENELFGDNRIWGYCRATGNLVMHSRIWTRGVERNVIGGITYDPDIRAGDVIRIEARFFATVYHTVTAAEEQLNAIAIPMDRVPIPYLTVELRNATADADVPPLVPAGATPWVNRFSPPSDLAIPLAGMAFPAPQHASRFNANGSLLFDFFQGGAINFEPNTITLRYEQIRIPAGGVATATDPYVIWLLVEDTVVPRQTLTIVRHDDAENEDGYVAVNLPHGGITEFGNPGVSGHFRVYFRHPGGYPVAAQVVNNSGATGWVIDNLTLTTEIRVVPHDNHPIPGAGNNWTYRPSEWITFNTLFDDDTNTFQIDVEPEWHAEVHTVERIEIIPGLDLVHYIYVDADLYHEADMGLDQYVDRVPPRIGAGMWRPVRVLDGETLRAYHDDYISPEIHEVVIPTDDDDDDCDIIFIYMERRAQGRIYGFVLDAEMLTDPTVLRPLVGAAVTVLNSAGEVAATATSGQNGFWEVVGLEPGTYTVIGTHNNRSAFSVPNPVVLTSDTNARADIFIGEDDGFLYLVRVMDRDQNVSSNSTVTLTYPVDNVVGASYEPSFQVLRLNPDLGWLSEGQITAVNDGRAVTRAATDYDFRLPGLAVMTIDMPRERLENLEVWVITDERSRNMLLYDYLIQDATLTHNRNSITARPYHGFLGTFFIPYAYSGDVLRAEGTVNGVLSHAIRNLTPQDAHADIIVIRISHVIPADDFEVRVVDRRGNLITTSRLISPAMTSTTGIFRLNREDVEVGQRITATAPGWRQYPYAGYVIVNQAAIDVGHIYIMLHDNWLEPFDLGVTVVNRDGVTITTATLQYNSPARPGGWQGPFDPRVEGSNGVFTVRDALIGGVLYASAPGFATSPARTIVYRDAATGHIYIVLDVYVPVEVTVNVRSGSITGSLIPTAWLQHPSFDAERLTTTDGTFTITLNGSHVGTGLTAGAYGFISRDRVITFADLASPRIIDIYLEAGWIDPDTRITVEVRRQSDRMLIPTAALEGVPANLITARNDGTFILAIDGSHVNSELRARASGFAPNTHAISHQDLAPPRTIVIYLDGGDDRYAVELDVYVVLEVTTPLVPLTISTLTRYLSLPAPYAPVGGQGRWTVRMLGDHINTTTLTGNAPGFVPQDRIITFEDLDNADRPVVIALGGAVMPTPIYFRIVDSAGRAIPTALLTQVTATLVPLPAPGGATGTGKSDHWRAQVAGSLAVTGARFYASAPGFNTNVYILTIEGLAMYGRGYIEIVLGRDTAGYDDVDVQVRVYRYVADGENVLLPTAALSGVERIQVNSPPNGTFVITVDGSYYGRILTATAPGFMAYSHRITYFDMYNGLISIVLGGPNGYEPVDMTVLVADAAAPTVALTGSQLVHSGGVAVGGANGNFTIRLDGRHIGDTLDASHNLFMSHNHPVSLQDLVAGHVTILLLEGQPQTFTVRVVDSAAPSRLIPTATLLSEVGSVVPVAGQPGVFVVTATSAAAGRMLTANAPGFNPVQRPIALEYFGTEITIQLGQQGEGYNDVNVNVRVYRYVAGAVGNQLLTTAALTGADRITPVLVNDSPTGRFVAVINGSYVGRSLRAHAPGFAPYYHPITFYDLDGRDIVIVLGGPNGYEYVDVRVAVTSNNAELNPLTTAGLTLPEGATSTPVAGQPGVWTVRMTGQHVGQVLTAHAPVHEDARHTVTVDNLRDREIDITLIEGDANLVTIRVVNRNDDLIPTASVDILGYEAMSIDNTGMFSLLLTTGMYGHSLHASAPGFQDASHVIIEAYFESDAVITIVLDQYKSVNMTARVYRQRGATRILIPSATLTGVEGITADHENKGTFSFTLDGSHVGRTLTAGAPGFESRNHVVTFVDLYREIIEFVLVLRGDNTICIDVGRDGTVTVTPPPGVEYYVRDNNEVNENGNIVVEIRPEDQDNPVNRENIEVNTPGNDWQYEIIPDPDTDGGYLIIITPPTISGGTDNNGNHYVTRPPGDGDREWTQRPPGNNGEIIIDPPAGWNPDDDLVIIDLPDDWDYEKRSDGDGNYYIIIWPPRIDEPTDAPTDVTPPPPPPLPPHEVSLEPEGIPWTPRQPVELDYFITRIDEVYYLPPPDLSHVEPTRFAYMIGDQNGRVRPTDNITRAEAATIFFRLITDSHRSDIWSQTNTFVDVQSNRWFNNPISTMQRGGLFAGMPLGENFGPDQALTRAEFAAMVVNYLGLGTFRVANGDIFTDIQGHWASDAIEMAYLQGWVRGFGDGTFRPDQLITRAEVAALVNRALGRLPQYTSDLLPGMVTFPDNMNENAWYYLYIQSAVNSYYHEIKADGIHETWTQLITPRNWRALERPYSQPNSW